MSNSEKHVNRCYYVLTPKETIKVILKSQHIELNKKVLCPFFFRVRPRQSVVFLVSNRYSVYYSHLQHSLWQRCTAHSSLFTPHKWMEMWLIFCFFFYISRYCFQVLWPVNGDKAILSSAAGFNQSRCSNRELQRWNFSERQIVIKKQQQTAVNGVVFLFLLIFSCIWLQISDIGTFSCDIIGANQLNQLMFSELLGVPV